MHTCIYVLLLFHKLQVLSDSVSKALQLTGGEEASETAKFVGMVDKFFDALNVHNYTHGIHSRKRFRMPYTTGKDMRLKVCTQHAPAWAVHCEPTVLCSCFRNAVARERLLDLP